MALFGRHPSKYHGELYILNGRHRRNEVKTLENKAYHLATITSQTILIQTHVDGMGNENWVHAMRKNLDGPWSCKNGAGPLYPTCYFPLVLASVH